MRIGITQRIVQADAYVEARDALAHDWARFMAAALPEAVWVPIPNVGPDVVRWASAVGLDGLILSGGETPGDAPLRDATEAALVDWAETESLPVLGICRGLQFALMRAGCVLHPCDRELHVASRHRVRKFAAPQGLPSLPDEVNSYHTVGVPAATGLPDGWIVLAVSSDGMIEAASDATSRMLLLMWHPERDEHPDPASVELVRYLFIEERP
ncbi:gamma-glutamyl-gamma-aminobutyrate hydrolase family protein [Thalassobaculum sp. OXR-137]|uniref:gamma-glutamyl-gamma-aminobutyrate hydrolase family protein n=1 Tax=Thalassobaculum sp. OXR-137 TaxID=3100173 RepID=UPI002AC8B66D|nr:gamma-glutamyl-gamma-aminobutyrate hydrolase family protein [Thalassobaculum sp. OXR-137]WPZ36191.1 gamma-glutamyl-gamma-aminobutyrate hydrolase family protein [Thalassobaculum sp. OXR-137]